MSKNINATHYDLIPAYPSGSKKRKRIVHAVIETPKRSCQKYALVPEYGIIAFDSVLPDKMEWPYDYGFIPQTLAPDGDPLDVLLINDNGLFSGCLIEARIIGAVRESKDDTENDRLLAVLPPSKGAEQRTDAYYDISDVPAKMLEEIKTFLVEYSARQGHRVEIKGMVGADEAMRIVKRQMKAFKKAS
jgi:inorganic pyrophosphatase